MQVELTWPKPKAKDRPRMTRRGRAYTPEATTLAEAALAAQWPAVEPFTGPLSVSVMFTDTTVEVEINEVEKHKTKGKRGDLDNYVKLVLDALNGVAYVDDKQIIHLEARWL